MYNQEKMHVALRAFDWPTALALLPQQILEALRELLSDVSRSGCFIRLYPPSSKENESRAKMIDELKAFTARLGGTHAMKYLEFLLLQVEITELALVQIEGTLDRDEYRALPADQQAWSTLMWAAREMVDVDRQAQAGLTSQGKGKPVVFDPLTLRVGKEHGNGLAAGRLHQLSLTLANTLRMLGHRNRWTASGKFMLPPRGDQDEKNLLAASRISRLGDIWQHVVNESKYHRYWGGHFEVRDADEESKSLRPDLEHVIVSLRTDPEKSNDLQISEYIAVSRMQRKQFSVAMNIARSTAKDRVKNPRVEIVSLAPDELVSELEMATLYLLDNDMYFNPLKNRTTFGGLTILEWLRGYSILQKCYVGESGVSSDAVVKIDPGELSATLLRGGLNERKAKIFLERVTFQAGRRDLYDAPLLLTTDGQLFFVAALYRGGVDIAMIISSQIGSQKLNVDSKGKTFERAVVKMFEEAGLLARTFTFTIGSSSYDCDVAVLWDRHLFIFECKNYGLPTPDPADRLFFWMKQVAAFRQVERIAKDLTDHPDIVRRNFGENATWDEVHTVVLNASFLSFPKSRTGTFSYDASALGRFLKEGTLNEIYSIPINGKTMEMSFEAKRLWTGERPAPQDLLREMERPSQVTIEREKYYIARKLLALSKTTAVIIEEPASKPPDFEPLVPPADAKTSSD
jgi:hypothetical protein